MLASDYVLTLDEMPDLKTYTTQSSSLKKPNLLKIYPTHFNDSFTISSKETLQSISIYDQRGGKIKTLNPKATHAMVSLVGLPSGVYLVKANANPAVRVIKK
jgi:hypothetical protein